MLTDNRMQRKPGELAGLSIGVCDILALDLSSAVFHLICQHIVYSSLRIRLGCDGADGLSHLCMALDKFPTQLFNNRRLCYNFCKKTVSPKLELSTKR